MIQPETPTKPVWLGEIASKVWDDTLADLEKVPGLLIHVDSDLLAVYCDCWATYHEASAIIGKEGMTAAGSNGSVYQHPAVGIRNKAADRIASIAKQFGMCPEGRKRLNVAVFDAADDPLAEFLK